MKLNRLLLTLSIIIIIIWLSMKHRRELYEEADKKALDDYLIDSDKVDPEVIKTMVEKLTTDQVLLSKFYSAAQRDDRVTLINLTEDV
jgi:hypothetical protein